MDFTEIFQLKGLKFKNKGHMNFYECCDLTKKVYLILTDMYTMAFLVWTKASSDWSVKWCIWEWTRDACSSVGSSALSHSSRFNLEKNNTKDIVWFGTICDDL